MITETTKKNDQTVFKGPSSIEQPDFNSLFANTDPRAPNHLRQHSFGGRSEAINEEVSTNKLEQHFQSLMSLDLVRQVSSSSKMSVTTRQQAAHMEALRDALPDRLVSASPFQQKPHMMFGQRKQRQLYSDAFDKEMNHMHFMQTPQRPSQQYVRLPSNETQLQLSPAPQGARMMIGMSPITTSSRINASGSLDRSMTLPTFSLPMQIHSNGAGIQQAAIPEDDKAASYNRNVEPINLIRQFSVNMHKIPVAERLVLAHEGSEATPEQTAGVSTLTNTPQFQTQTGESGKSARKQNGVQCAPKEVCRVIIQTGDVSPQKDNSLTLHCGEKMLNEKNFKTPKRSKCNDKRETKSHQKSAKGSSNRRRRLFEKDLVCPVVPSEESPATLKVSEEQKSQVEEKQGEPPLKCSCAKSRCLKLYCECFARGAVCGKDCGCTGCQNVDGNEELKEAAKADILKRDPEAFKAKLQKSEARLQHRKGCTCKRSGCSKGYCECYQLGVPCMDLCKCIGCTNCTPRSPASAGTPLQMFEVEKTPQKETPVRHSTRQSAQRCMEDSNQEFTSPSRKRQRHN